MSMRSDIPSAESTEHIDGNSYGGQQELHQTRGIGETSTAAVPVVNFNTSHISGTVTNVFGNIYNVNTQNSFYLDRAFRARFDCGGRIACAGGTRVDVINTVDMWADDGPPVFWLNGSAGTGKSTIAFTLAKSFNDMGILGASFFCSRDDATCSNHKLIFPSIADQLARFHPQFGQLLADVVRRQPEVIHSDPAYQLQELIVLPLAKTNDFPQRCVIVIDALDECKDDSTISVILAALSRHVEKLAPLKIFLASRPERSINLGFDESVLQGATHRFILHEIQLSTVEADIKIYLVAQLEITRREYGIKQSWPSGVEVDSLSTLSCGLFIFAVTAIKFIQDRNYDDPQKQLARIISNAMPLKDEHSEPLHRLDLLYLQVLMNAHPKPSSELAERLRLLLGTIVLLQDPLSFHGIQQLLKYQLVNRFETQSMRQTLMRLHSIILVPEGDNDIIRTLHPSFFDFITNPGRCSIPHLLVDTSQQHTLLLAACLRTMQGLKCNICELPDPSVLNNEVVDLSWRIANFIPPELQYACRHWGTHLRHAVISEDISMLLSQFCSEQMIFWIEACSLLGDLRNQLVLLGAVRRKLAVSICIILLRTILIGYDKHDRKGSATAAMTLLHECERLIREFFPAISTAWAHVYDSALSFAPQGSALRKCYASRIKVIGGPADWNLCSIIETHSICVFSVVYSPDGSRIASGYTDGNIRLWDAISGEHLNTLEGHSSSVNSVAFSPDGARIISGSADGRICLWNSLSGKFWKTLKEKLPSVSSVVYSPDGSRIASGSTGGSIRLWDANSGAHLYTLEKHSSSVNSIAFSPNGAIIVSGSNSKTIWLWDAVSGKHLVTLEGHLGGVRSVAYSPDGTRIASGSSDCTIKIWDAIKWKHRKTLKGHQSGVNAVAFSPDGATIVSASDDKTIRLWDAASGEHLINLRGHAKSVSSVSFSPDGTRIVSGSEDKTIRLWITGHGIQPKRAGKEAILRAFSKLKTYHSLASIDHISDTDSLLLSYSPHASLIVTVPLCGFPKLWDAASGAYLATLPGYTDQRRKMALSHGDTLPVTVAFSHDGTRIACADGERVQLWDIPSWGDAKILEGHRQPVLSVTFSPNGTRIASGSKDSTTRLWDAVTGAPVRILKGHQGAVVSVKFSPDGTRIASGSANGIRLWNVLCGELLVTVKVAYFMLQSIAFSPDGDHLSVATFDCVRWCLQLRDLHDNGELLKVIPWHKASPALWLPFLPEHRDLRTDDNFNPQWAQPSEPNDNYNYFLQDGWVWLAHPRRRLCWVPLACRGLRFVSSMSQIAFGTEDLGIVIIDFSDVLEGLEALQRPADAKAAGETIRKV